MIVNYLALLIALVLSAVAAYYSIAGLAVIFASAVVPVVVMASALEAGKVISASWLYRNWHTAPRFIKYYLTIAVVILMFITSMGIFGFLSKAHSDQALVTGDVASQVSLIDSQIEIERSNIANAQSLIKQMDDAVNGISANGQDREIKLRNGTSYTRSAAELALQTRRSQAKDRADLTKRIEEGQAKIIELQQKKAPIAADLRKVEAEVGPIKYIAALIYGDNPDQNIIERAVRLVIMCLVGVFDPLAIILLLAANFSLANARPVTIKPPIAQPPKVEDDDRWLKFFDKGEDHGNCPKCNTKLAHATGIGIFCPNKACEIVDDVMETVTAPVDVPSPVQEPVQEQEQWSSRWYQRAKQLISKKKSGTIEINKDSIVNLK